MRVLVLLLFISLNVFGQGKSISLVKKSKEPIELINGVTLKVDDEIKIKTGSNADGSFKFIQDLNNFNEPIQNSTSRIAFMKQPIKFFKNENGVNYVFTKFFVINIEAALQEKEVELNL